MKVRSLVCTAVLAAAFAGSASALTPITENFDAPGLDTSRWFAYKLGKAKFKQENGKLNLLVAAKPVHENFTSIELMNSYPGYNENWQFTIDLENTANLGDKAGAGFMIFNHGDRDDYLYVEFYGKGGISGGVLLNGKPAKAGRFTYLGVPKGSIKVVYNKNTNLLTFYASLTGSGSGAEWKKIGKFSPTGSGGDVRANWRMKPNGKFGIQLFGFSEEKVVQSGKITLDNLVLSAGN